MNKPNQRSLETFADRIEDKHDFDTEYVLVVMDSDHTCTSVRGGDDFAAARLILNCVYEDWLARRGRECDPAPDSQPTTKRPSPDVWIMEALIDEMRQVEGEKFVICYRTSYDARWRMAWSDGLSPEEAYEEVLTYVQCGCDPREISP